MLAAEAGCNGVVLSNHGGRQLETSRSGIEILVEVVDALKQRKLWNPERFPVFIDGGVRVRPKLAPAELTLQRASDVLKAVALGASGVGIGRPFLYAMSAYGEEGVRHAIQVLKDEMEMNMRLIGAPTLRDLSPSMVDTSAISQRNVAAPTVSQAVSIYEPLPPLVRGGGIAAKL